MRTVTRTIKLTGSDKVFHIIDYLVLSVAWVAVIYPLINVLAHSFSSSNAVAQGLVYFFPVEPNFLAYKAVFRNKWLMVGYGNSLYYASVGTMINIAMTIMVAYPLSLKKFVGRGWITFLFTFTMLFGGGLIPTYLVVKSLGMVNTRWAMMIPNAMGVWYMIIARTFFQQNIPDELRDAAEIDGSSDLQFIGRIVVPLSVPVIAVLGLFYAVEHWNSYFQALIYLNDIELFNLQLIIRNILSSTEMIMQSTESGNANIDEALTRAEFIEVVKYATIVVAIAPVLILYPFVQKYFVKGIMIGSLKG